MLSRKGKVELHQDAVVPWWYSDFLQ